MKGNDWRLYWVFVAIYGSCISLIILLIKLLTHTERIDWWDVPSPFVLALLFYSICKIFFRPKRRCRICAGKGYIHSGRTIGNANPFDDCPICFGKGLI